MNALFRIHGLLAILMSKYSARWSGGPVFPIKNAQITQMLAHGKIERTVDLPNQLQNYFQMWYQSFLVKPRYGTPTAILIRKISGRLKDDWGVTADITLWRIRVFAKNVGKIKLFTYKKKQCMEDICNPSTIYKELIHAYHSGTTFSKRL